MRMMTREDRTAVARGMIFAVTIAALIMLLGLFHA